VGLSANTELQVASKVNNNSTYSATANYWAPLINQEGGEDDNVEHHYQPITINSISNADVQCDLQATINAWINQWISTNKPFEKKASTMILDSGVTSHFMWPDKNLPNMEKSTKVVSLPNGAIIKASHTTNLPFPSLSAKARQADALPGLRHNSLVSIGKFADASYTTIFHPHGKGVTVHQPGTFKVKLLHKPVLQGWRDANGLWQLLQIPLRTTTHASRKQQEVALMFTPYRLFLRPSYIYMWQRAFSSRINGSKQSKMDIMCCGRVSQPKQLVNTSQNLLRHKKGT
jgi:hypothetical protein